MTHGVNGGGGGDVGILHNNAENYIQLPSAEKIQNEYLNAICICFSSLFLHSVSVMGTYT